MGRIFKTPTDDSTEATLRAMHTQVILCFVTALVISFWELSTGESFWDNTVEWLWNKVQNFADWIWGKVDG